MCLRPIFLSLALAAALAAQDPPARSSGPHLRFGGLVAGVGYSHFSGGYMYSPMFWPSFYYPYYYTGFSYQPGMGQVKLQAPDKTALVYIDGAFAGRVSELKSMWLAPGSYQLELRAGTQRMTQKIYVLTGRTLRVRSGEMTSEALQ